MEAIIKSFNALATELKLALARTNEREVSATSKLAKLDQREAKLNDLESSLRSRENAVSKIEDVAQMKQDAIALDKKAGKLLFDLQEEQRANRAANDTEKEALANERKALNLDKERFLDDSKLLKRSWQELRDKEKSYKEEIKNAITKKLG